MKIATRLALLQWQANPADPANLWRLVLAWMIPGLREPTKEKTTKRRPNTPGYWEKAEPAAAGPDVASLAILDSLGELMERHPTALMGTSWLPAPKQTIKAVIKDVWRQEPRLRPQLTHAYLHLSNFQDGIGDAVLDCKLPEINKRPDGTPALEAVRQLAVDISGPDGQNFRQWIVWSKVALAEMEILSEEWRVFENQASDQR